MSREEEEALREKLNSLLLEPKKREILWDNLGELSAMYRKSLATAKTLRDAKSMDYVGALSPKAQSMMKLLAYLGLVESLGVTLLDMVLFLLIVDGKEMHVSGGGGIKHVSTLSELKRLKLGYKLYFLKAHGLSFFGKPIKQDLRSEIAHLSFNVEKNGTIRDSNGHEIDIDDTIMSFWRSVGEITSIFREGLFMKFLDDAERQKAQENFNQTARERVQTERAKEQAK